VDLGQVKIVTGIATQGDSSEPMWVTSYNLEFKRDGGSWYEYTPGNNIEASDNASIVSKIFISSIYYFSIKKQK
jgi:hypothetical protein